MNSLGIGEILVLEAFVVFALVHVIRRGSSVVSRGARRLLITILVVGILILPIGVLAALTYLVLVRSRKNPNGYLDSGGAPQFQRE